MTRKVGIGAALLGTLAAGSAGIAVAAPGGGTGAASADNAAGPTAQAAKPIRYDSNDLFIEINDTDGDAGLQLDLDAEAWKRLTLKDPKGRKAMLKVNARGRLRSWGLTELKFETSEPEFDEVPFSKFKKRFPEGKYAFRGRDVDGRRLNGSDRLSHRVPKAPVVTTPTKGATVDPDGFTVTWEPVTKPSGVKIVRYLVIVTQERPERELSMEVTPDVTSVSVPGAFLDPDTKTKVEVLARDKNGNQTITEIPFKTGA